MVLRNYGNARVQQQKALKRLSYKSVYSTTHSAQVCIVVLLCPFADCSVTNSSPGGVQVDVLHVTQDAVVPTTSALSQASFACASEADAISGEVHKDAPPTAQSSVVPHVFVLLKLCLLFVQGQMPVQRGSTGTSCLLQILWVPSRVCSSHLLCAFRSGADANPQGV